LTRLCFIAPAGRNGTRAIAPDYALGAHVAALGLAFPDGARLGPAYASGAFIGFLAGDKAMGRPAGIEIARDGAVLVADDVSNTVWRVSAQ
jgi:glucose/arabinose dehydrogenase